MLFPTQPFACYSLFYALYYSCTTHLWHSSCSLNPVASLSLCRGMSPKTQWAKAILVSYSCALHSRRSVPSLNLLPVLPCFSQRYRPRLALARTQYVVCCFKYHRSRSAMQRYIAEVHIGMESSCTAATPSSFVHTTTPRYYNDLWLPATLRLQSQLLLPVLSHLL